MNRVHLYSEYKILSEFAQLQYNHEVLTAKLEDLTKIKLPSHGK